MTSRTGAPNQKPLVTVRDAGGRLALRLAGEAAPAELPGLKHRATTETRSIPVPPVLVAMLRGHIAWYSTAPDGRLRSAGAGEPLHDSAGARAQRGRDSSWRSRLLCD